MELKSFHCSFILLILLCGMHLSIGLKMKNTTPGQEIQEKYTFLNFKMELVKQLTETDQKAAKGFGDANIIQPYASLDTKTKDIDSLSSEINLQS